MNTNVSILTWCVATALGFAAAGTPAVAEEKEMEKTKRLQVQLDEYRAEFNERAADAVKKTYDEGVEEVAQSGVLESALKVGDKAPDFTLPDATGNDVPLSALLAEGPVVLTWYRGGWCPYCNIQLRAMQAVLADIQAKGATLAALSPETPDNSLDTKQKSDLAFHVLSDAGNEVAKDYGVVYTLPKGVQEAFDGRIDLAAYNGDQSMELPLAATYVIASDGTVAYAFIDKDYRKRAEPSAILDALEDLSK